MLCTSSRAKKVVVGLTLVALISAAANTAAVHLFQSGIAGYISMIVFNAIVPVTVLVTNVIVVRRVCRRASSDAATNLGHQSTSSNSTVPTVMLVATSIIYLLLNGAASFSHVAYFALEIRLSDEFVGNTFLLFRVVYAYNFYVYLITGKQFRSELYTLCGCLSSSSSSSSANTNVRVARRGQADTAV